MKNRSLGVRFNMSPARFALALLVCGAALHAAGGVDASTLDGKVLIGYQGWFACPQDGTQWSHWSRGVPSADTLSIDLYPDLGELDPDERCAIPGMTIGGKPAYLFSSRIPKTVDRHFRWMKEYGLDGVLVQRFVGTIRAKHADGDLVLKNIMAAAAANGRTFAIEYDISGGNPQTFAQTLKDDWIYLVDQMKVTSQPNYQRHNGKPVLSVWGMGLNDGNNHPPTDPQVAKDLIEWFQSKAPAKYRVTYMGGTPARWRTLTADARSDPAWADVYAMMDVIQPWNVGRYGTMDAVERWKDDVLTPDAKLTASRHQIYMPVVFPGFSWHNLRRSARENQIPRLRGEFLWRQAYNARMAGARVLKIAMFDEVNEGTAIFKAASHRKDAPDQGYWLTLDADGADLPSDWYLRLAGEITRVFHGEVAPDSRLPAHPGPPEQRPARQ
jgi:hypothetical protein